MRTITLLTLLLYFALPALAADADGNYAVKGAGIATCADFAKAKEASEREYFMYAGWAEGFISAANLYEDSTFDIVPWQNTDVLATALASYCRNVPTQKFHLAVSRMMQGEREFGLAPVWALAAWLLAPVVVSILAKYTAGKDRPAR